MSPMAGKAILQRFCIPNETPLSEAEFHKICDGRPKQQELEKGPVSPDKSGNRTSPPLPSWQFHLYGKRVNQALTLRASLSRLSVPGPISSSSRTPTNSQSQRVQKSGKSRGERHHTSTS